MNTQILPNDTMINIGVSSCLLGESIRWDGAHKRDALIAGTIAPKFNLLPICPEMGIGMGTPRPPIKLMRLEDVTRALVEGNTEQDVTENLKNYVHDIRHNLADLSGFIVKSDSPSCGLNTLKVFRQKGGGPPWKDGKGIFSSALKNLLPWLPMQDETRLGESEPRAHFFDRVYALNRWQKMARDRLTLEKLKFFHETHRIKVLVRSNDDFRKLERILNAAPSDHNPDALSAIAEEYIGAFMDILESMPGRKQHANMLLYLTSLLKNNISLSDKTVLKRMIDLYSKGELPRLAPVVLLSHHFRHHPHPFAENQIYLQTTEKSRWLDFGGG